MPPTASRSRIRRQCGVLAWIKAEMKRSRRNFTQRLQQISGNKVQHDLLFDPTKLRG